MLSAQKEIRVPRPNRICIPGLPHHLTQRGNDQQPTFFADKDYTTYLAYLEDAAGEHGIAVHAYVLMTNHVHVLVTPAESTSLSLAIQALGRRYVTYINKKYLRTGTLWEGRFKSSVVDSDYYCLACYRYIELNPVRAGMVVAPAEYRWSSYPRNGLGKTDSLITPHPVYLALAQTRSAQATRYRRIIRENLQPEVVEKLRYGARKGLPVGNARFKADVEKQLGRRLGTGRPGRPRKR